MCGRYVLAHGRGGSGRTTANLARVQSSVTGRRFHVGARRTKRERSRPCLLPARASEGGWRAGIAIDEPKPARFKVSVVIDRAKLIRSVVSPGAGGVSFGIAGPKLVGSGASFGLTGPELVRSGVSFGLTGAELVRSGATVVIDRAKLVRPVASFGSIERREVARKRGKRTRCRAALAQRLAKLPVARRNVAAVGRSDACECGLHVSNVIRVEDEGESNHGS